MKPLHLTIAAGGALGVALALGAFGMFAPAEAQQQPVKQASTPDNFPYEIVNGKRVPRGKRVTAADGSWKEEIKDGTCSTVKEKTASGEYREVRKCD